MKPCFLFWNQHAKTMTPVPPVRRKVIHPPITFLSNGGSNVLCTWWWSSWPPRRGFVCETNVREVGAFFGLRVGGGGRRLGVSQRPVRNQATVHRGPGRCARASVDSDPARSSLPVTPGEKRTPAAEDGVFGMFLAAPRRTLPAARHACQPSIRATPSSRATSRPRPWLCSSGPADHLLQVACALPRNGQVLMTLISPPCENATQQL